MGEGELTTTAKRRQTDAPKLVHLVRGDLDWIVMKCLEKDRTRRYETANGLAMDLQAAPRTTSRCWRGRPAPPIGFKNGAAEQAGLRRRRC
jgi:hypothetical protein